MEAEIRDLCEQIEVPERAAALVYYAESWHRGVLGIVASRLVERLHRPVFVLGRNEEDGLAQGSGRSIEAFHLLDALESMPDLFVRFGGHSHAAGVTLEAARVEEFRERFNAYALARLSPEDLRPRLRIDAILELPEITDAAVDDIFALAPFGHGNPPPLFAALDVEMAGTARNSEREAPAFDRAPERPLAYAQSLELRGARGGIGAGRARGYRFFH